jgi:hypothetical protein
MWSLASVLIFILVVSVATDTRSADTNTVSSTVVTNSTPPTANAPSVVVNNSDVCKTAASASIQTQVLGFASGITITDENCEKIKLSRSLYAMGMKVAAVSLLCSDARTFDAMWNAGTYCPYRGSIGEEAKQGWESNPTDVPPGSTIFNTNIEQTKEKVESDKEFAKFIIAAMALYIGFPILF